MVAIIKNVKEEGPGSIEEALERGLKALGGFALEPSSLPMCFAGEFTKVQGLRLAGLT
jgi:hypothetical protein